VDDNEKLVNVRDMVADKKIYQYFIGLFNEQMGRNTDHVFGRPFDSHGILLYVSHRLRYMW
jgi:hypothetical protein